MNAGPTASTLEGEDGVERVWNQVVDLHALVLGWFEDRDLFHKIGYLVAAGHHFGDLVGEAKGRTKSAFDRRLNELIANTLDLTTSKLTALSYQTHEDKCQLLLLLMNVEAVRKLESSTERFSFRFSHDNVWSLEHIHAQHAESLTKAEQWKEWLRVHRNALVTLTSVDPMKRDALVAKLEQARDDIGRETFQSLAREVTDIFTSAEGESAGSAHSMHSVTNLALLSCGDNSALGNAVFEVKRRRILALDKAGSYIPLCTRHVFLKYFTGADAQQTHFWSRQDRDCYLQAMIGPEGLLSPYLKTEERPS